MLASLRSQRFALLLAASTTIFGCAGAGASTPKPEPMPPSAEWRGVYQGPYHIQLQIETHGNRASGTWRAVGGREGEFSGTVAGNLLVIDFSERGLQNSEAWSGRGYFVYRAGKAGAPDEITGEWGLGPGGPKSSWWAIKRGGPELGAGELVDNDVAEDERGDSPSCGIGCDSEDDAESE